MIKEEEYFKKIISALILIGLIILLFLVIRPILFAIIIGLILAFILFPIYSFIYKKTKSKNFSAAIVCLFLIGIIVTPLVFLFPYVIEQLIVSYNSLTQLDLVTPFKAIFSSIIPDDAIFIMAENTFKSAINNLINSFLGSITIDNIISFAFNLVVVFFTLFFALRDNAELNNYIKSLLPFPKEVEQKLFNSSKEITGSILYGQVIIGIIQGLSLGLGFLVFSVPNGFFLTILSIIAGIFPLIGPFVIWVPVFFYLILEGNASAAFGILIFGLFSSNIDNILRPFFISKKANISSSIALIGMIGGWFLFGILGIILGPLIIAYFLIIIETYRSKNEPSLLIKN